MTAHFLLLRGGQQCLLFKKFLQFFSGNDCVGAIRPIASIELGLSGYGIVDVAGATHTILTCVLAQYLRL